jgi:hypothetical protein
VRVKALAAGEHLSLHRAAGADGQVAATGRELRDADVVVAGVADTVSVGVLLTRVGYGGAVVRGVSHAVAVAVGIADIADAVPVLVLLTGVRDVRAVVVRVRAAVAVAIAGANSHVGVPRLKEQGDAFRVLLVGRAGYGSAGEVTGEDQA